ncbi:hypothetical protein NP233_g4543 [Leucocoprinus birnbaumii]|uniref:Uncharacterized protein n=1 Tax=Leucocoprinus birnbaumii TaxID=56174 RepID=A0AAD5VUH8_9AGAR|nr:hypothetical protein NP233_g4543 [Leucocoprinus birnbaumii]
MKDISSSAHEESSSSSQQRQSNETSNSRKDMWKGTLPGARASSVPQHDVKKSLEQKLKKAREDHPNHAYPTPWSTKDQLSRLTTAASTHTEIAEVVTRFISASNCAGSPMDNLDYILSIVPESPLPSAESNGLRILDAIYTGIMARIPLNILDAAKQLLGSIFLIHKRSIKIHDFNFGDIYSSLNISRETAISVIVSLSSALYLPRVTDVSRTQPRIYHAAFRDFLLAPIRSGEFCVDLESCLDLLTQGFLSRLEERLLGGPTPEDWNGRVGRFVSAIIRSNISQNGTTIDYKVISNTRHFIPDDKLQTSFERINFRWLVQNNIQSVFGVLSQHPFDRVLKSILSQDNQLHEFSRRGLLTTLNYGSFDDWSTKITSYSCSWFENRVNDSHSFFHLGPSLQSPNAMRAIDLEKAPFQSALAKHMLERCIIEFPEMRVMIWGCDNDSRCGVIAIDDLPPFWPVEMRYAVYFTGL